MPATAAPAHVPAVDQPQHPLPALATFELAAYRRQLENAIAFSGAQQPVPPDTGRPARQARCRAGRAGRPR